VDYDSAAAVFPADAKSHPRCGTAVAPGGCPSEGEPGVRQEHAALAVVDGNIRREQSMSAPSSLKEVYLDEIKDLWSANDQMIKVVRELGGHASDAKLKQMLEHSVGGIQKHTDILKQLIQQAGGETEPEHCKGMDGLVSEARKHGIKEAPSDGKLRDVEIIAQYQRMSHYGLAGFGSAAAYAKALGKSEDEQKLKQAVAEIYKGDEFASKLAESLEQVAA
jgi:ferritin-like metal-binding protein YciE